MILEPNPMGPTAAPGLCYAGSTVDITPPLPVALAGSIQITRSRSVATALEANAVLLDDGVVRVLMISADLLYFGPELVDAVHRCAEQCGIPAPCVILAASHTHFAPATDRTKPRLGEVDAGYETFVRDRLLDLVLAVTSSPMAAVAIEATRATCDLSVNRRRRWPLPTLTREGLKLGPSVVMAPAPDGPRDPHLDVLRLVDASGKVVCVVWKFACHPVCFPDRASVSSEYPGRARDRLRQSLGHSLPVLFLQGFTGDVRPRLPGRYSLKARLNALRLGPGFSSPSQAQWTHWADAMAELLLDCVGQRGARSVTGALDVGCVDIAMSHFIDPVLNPRAVQRPLRVQRLAFGDRIELLFLAAEVCSPYLALFGAGERTLCVGYTGHVFGYLPSQRQAGEGGYEGQGYFARFGLAGTLRPGFESALVDAVKQLRTAPARAAGSREAAVEPAG